MADGSTEIDRLTVVWDANFAKFDEKLNKVIRSHYDAAGKMTKKLDEVDGRWDRLFGKTDPGKALDKIFDGSRLRLFDSATARIGLTGSALEALGPVGLTAAAGVAALAGALEEAHQAIEFADSLEKLAKSAHVTTDELQATQFALRESGGEAANAAPAMTAFSEVLGKAEAGVPRALRAFRELFGQGFSAADARNLAQSGEALTKVTAAIAGLKDVSQKDAIVQQFGLEGLRQLIEEGPDKIRELKQAAQESGNVMDAELVKRGAELNREVETLQTRIKVDLASAFVSLGPILVKLLGFLADMADHAERVTAAFAPLESRSTKILEREQRGLLARSETPESLIFGGPQADRARAARIQTELDRRAKEDKPPVTPPGGRNLFDVGKTGGPRDDTKQRQDAADAALAQADRERLQALAANTGNLERRAEFERQALDAEVTAEKARLQKQIDEVNADKGISDAAKQRITAELEVAKGLVDAAADAKREKLARESAFAIEDVQIGVHKEIVEAQLAELEAQAAIATTAKDRRDIEARILALRQQLERDLKTTQLDRDVKTGAKSQEQADAERRGLAQTQSAQQVQFGVAHEDPVEAFKRSVQDLDTVVQNGAITAFRQLSDQLGQSAAKALGLKGILGQLFAQIASAAIQKSGAEIFAAVAKAIPGFATGIRGFGGGWAVVGEQGPELLRLPAGTDVIPNGQVQAMASAGIAPPQGGSAVNLFDLRGAVMTQDLLDQMNQIAARTGVMSVQASRQFARSDLQRQARRALR